MKPCAFEMHRPRDLAEALELLERHGDEARLIVDGLAGVSRDGNVIRIGAMTRQQRLLDDELISRHAPLMAAAARHIGHYSTRSRGTVGGSLANADPSSELALVAVTLGAKMTIRSAAQTRTVEASDFFLDALQTALQPDEILTELVVPIAPAQATTAFREHARRHGDFAIASAAGQLSDGMLRVGLGAVCSVPIVCTGIQDAFRRGRLLAELDEVIAAEVAGIEVVSDVHTSAGYRRRLGAVCLADCVRELIA
jgi:2-furoyl-CoA dehydrogenase FAD binding subunit